MTDLKRIYLQPECCADPDTGRMWCENPDPESCEDGNHWTEYVRADRVKALEELVSHCWVHSDYENCGYRKMTKEQKKIFDSLTIELKF